MRQYFLIPHVDNSYNTLQKRNKSFHITSSSKQLARVVVRAEAIWGRSGDSRLTA
jgi:hypothetical protein